MIRRLAALVLIAAAACGDDDGPSAWPPSLAYVESKAPQRTYRIVRVTADGRRRQVLWDNGSSGEAPYLLRPSPSGASILFVLDNATSDPDPWYSIPTDSGDASLFTAPANGTAPQWAPDESAIAWLVFDDVNHLGITAPGSPTLTILTPDSLYVLAYFQWAPDASALVFCAQAPDSRVAIYSVARSGGPVQLVARDSLYDDCSPALAPSGTQLAFIRGGGQIMIAGPDGSSPQPLATATFTQGLFWSPNGAELMANVSGQQQMTRFVLGTGASIPTGRYGPEYPATPWSPDGRKIVFYGRTQPDSIGNTGPSLLVGEPDGSHPVQVTPDSVYGGGPVWIPSAG